MGDSLSTATTIRESEQDKSPRNQYSSPSPSQFGPDPPPPPKAIQAMRWIKYNVKHSFKAGTRPYNPYSGF